MPSDVWTVDSALNAVIEKARKGGPQVVTADGKPVAVVVNVDDYPGVIDQSDEDDDAFLEQLFSMPQGGDFEFERMDLEPRPVEF